MNRNRHLVALGAASIALAGACQFEPTVVELHYSLNEEAIQSNNLLADDRNAQGHLSGALEFLFGTATNPSYVVLPDWRDDEFDPNNWGYYLLSDEEFDALKESNATAYRSQIAAIEAGDLDAVVEPRYAGDLWARFQSLAADAPASLDDPFDEGDPEWSYKDELVSTFESYYPNQRTTADLYRQQCFHCHGAEGGGDGSTADFLNPRPRDYRPGTFKFTALKDKAKPRHADLMRILEEGIYTTAMPSFRRFTDAQLSALADYVRLLAIRGETEILMIADFDPDEGMVPELLQENYELVVDRWRAASDSFIEFDGDVPRFDSDDAQERIDRGEALYLSEKAANCVKCHGTTGRGDGESVKNNPDDATDDWGDPILPRDLTRGVFRFGRRPIDIYRRIYAGINGTPMPEHIGMQIIDPATEETRNMTEDDIWDLVFFVRSLSDKEPAADDHTDDEHGEASH